jgi:magnesium chelatase accessory protein
MDGPPPDWPFAAASRHRDGPVHRWNLAVTGEGPDLLLLHGTGAAGMSFRGLAPFLAPHYRLWIPDLPGHGFTRLGRRGRSGVDAMAEDLAALMVAEGARPVAAVGHSAGAVVALRMAEAGGLHAAVALNASLGHFEGAAGIAFPVMAKVLAVLPFVSNLFARTASSDRQIATLLASVGSPLDPQGRALYRALVSRRQHVDGALAMMAEWKLDPLLGRLPRIETPTLFVTAARDGAVPPHTSARAAARMPHATLAALPEGGHLIHEEAPERVAPLILAFLGKTLGPDASGR